MLGVLKGGQDALSLLKTTEACKQIDIQFLCSIHFIKGTPFYIYVLHTNILSIFGMIQFH